MISFRLTAVACLVAGFAPVGTLVSAPDNGLVGQIILPNKPLKEIKFWDAKGKKISALPLYDNFPFRVLAEANGRLRIHDGRREGWVAKKDFVPGRSAIDYFEERVDDDPKDAWAQYMLGEIAIVRREFEDAIDRLTDCLNADPNHVEAYIKRAQVWQAQGENKKAMKDLDAAIRIAAKNGAAYRSRGRLWAARAGKGANDENAAKALKDFAEAIRLDAHDIRAFSERGRLLMTKGDPAAALKDFDEIVRIAPDIPYGYIARGMYFKEAKKYDQALKEFDEAVRVDPKVEFTLELRGNLLHFLKQYDRAIKDFDAMLKINPDDAHALSQRGFAKSGKKQLDKAIEDYDRALEIDPEESWAGINRPVALLVLQKAGATDGFRNFLAKHGENHRLSMYARIFGHFAARQEGAKAAAKEFLSSRAKAKNLWPAPVMAFLRGEMDADALLEKAKTDGDKTEAHCYLGLHHMLKKESEEAARHFRWVVDNGETTFVEYVIAAAEFDRLKPAKR